MRSDVSERFKARLGAQATQWANEILWTNDGRTWQTARLVEGTVTRSLSDSVHWKASLTLAGVSADWSSINPLNTRLRLRHGIQFARGDVELLSFGLYRVTSASQGDLPGSVVEVEAESYESFLVGAELERPTTYPATTAGDALRRAAEPVLGDATSISWDPRIEAKSDTSVPEVMIDTTPWDYIDGDGSSTSVAAAIGARVIADADGGLLVIPTPTLQNDPVVEVKRGRGGLLVSRSTELTADGVANTVIVTGASVDGLSVGPVIVRDTDPESPTYYARPISQGGFGPVVYRYTSSLLLTEAQCAEAGRAKLAERIGLRQQVTFDSGHNPLIEPGDVLVVDGVRVILDSVTYSLTGSNLQADTRAQMALEDGSVWDVPDESDDDLGGEGA
jgi:hypothetical protein